MLDNYDTYADVGAETAVIKTFPVTVTNGTINIELGHVTENPAIKAIQISDTATQAGTLTASGNSAFGDVVVGSTVTDPVTFTNSGVGGDPDITITAASISGPNSTEFSHDLSTPVTLTPGASTTVTVTHTAGTTLGAKTATLSLVHDGNNSPTATNLTATTVASLPVGFGKSTLNGASTPEIATPSSRARRSPLYRITGRHDSYPDRGAHGRERLRHDRRRDPLRYLVDDESRRRRHGQQQHQLSPRHRLDGRPGSQRTR